MLSKEVSVSAIDTASETRARTIAAQLNVPYVAHPKDNAVVLMIGEQQLFLRRMTTPTLDWTIDFLSPAYREKRAKRTRKNDALSRALGLHKNPQLRVLDMSAGLGKDAYWIAYCGASVTLLERNPVLAFLLQEAILALRADPVEGAIGERMRVILTEADQYLPTVTSNQFDVAYYDPMFLPRRKSALVKKDMQIMHDLLGDDPTTDLGPGMLAHIPRFIVKRAKLDPPYYCDKAPFMTILTGSIRYEGYKT